MRKSKDWEKKKKKIQKIQLVDTEDYNYTCIKQKCKQCNKIKDINKMIKGVCDTCRSKK